MPEKPGSPGALPASSEQLPVPSSDSEVPVAASSPFASCTAVELLRGRILSKTKGGLRKEIAELFQKCARGDGTADELSPEGLENMVRRPLKLGADELSDDEIANLFQVLDSDGSGTVSLAELAAFVSGSSPADSPQGGSSASPASGKKDKLSGNSPLSAQSPKRVPCCPGKVKGHSINQLHAIHKEKLEKNRLAREDKEQAELQQIEDSKRKAKRQGARRRHSGEQLNPENASSRLYRDFFESEGRLREKQRYYYELNMQQLEEEKLCNLPTRGMYDPAINNIRPGEASMRLYLDAERRERDRQLAQDAVEMAEQEEIAGRRRQIEATGDSDRYLFLYAEAAARKDRLEQRRLEAVSEAGRTAGANNRKGVNEARLCQLHQEHEKKQQRIARALAEKQQREAEEALLEVKKRRARISAAEQVNPYLKNSPQRVSVTELYKKKEEQVKEEKPKPTRAPKTQADHALATLVAAIRNRCGLDNDDVRGINHRSLLEPLKRAMTVYREALKSCEASDGFTPLIQRPSQRLFQEHLIPESEGWVRCIEPDPIRQVEERLEDLLVSAQSAQQALKEAIAGGPVTWEKAVRAHPDGLPIALFAYDPCVKSEAAARAKALVRYGPTEGPNRFRHLLDLSRILLVFASCDMLLAGLDQILRRFEVVDVRNFFATPGRLGVRFVEVLVVMHVGEGQDRIPHVCELRLEELCYHKAQELAAPYLETLFNGFRRLYSKAGWNQEALLHLVHTTLTRPANTHDLRVFKCHLAKRYGSTVCSWRRGFGGMRLLGFGKFREVCQTLNCGEHATEFFQGIDPTLAGCISLYDLDPEATSLLIKLRTGLHALSAMGADHDGHDTNAESLFGRLAFTVRPHRDGHLDIHEFRQAVKPLGFTTEEADKLFSYLDYYGGNHHAPPATVSIADIAWLNRLPQLVHTAAVTMSTGSRANFGAEAMKVSWAQARSRQQKRNEILRWGVAKVGVGPGSGNVSGGCSVGGSSSSCDGLRDSHSIRRAKSEDSLRSVSGRKAIPQDEIPSMLRTAQDDMPSMLHGAREFEPLQEEEPQDEDDDEAHVREEDDTFVEETGEDGHGETDAEVLAEAEEEEEEEEEVDEVQHEERSADEATALQESGDIWDDEDTF
eukprot:TRINITY_DN16783_c0_g4_i3.p1 TRINITY_DN16783_c0_g4~~TRINITY_DN16783_c0_g4_i3.p1  ORF type:complete len:1273 (+),score=297.06 TRINITY_DN16783_c0_g4_i3:436-3819(+)